MVERDYDRALHHAETLRNQHGGDLRRRVEADDLLGALHRMHGQFNAAEAYVRDAMWVSEERGRPAEYLKRSIELARMDLWRGRSPDRSLAHVDEALARYSIAEIKPLDVPWLELASLYARVGRPQLARHYLTQYEAVVDPKLPQRDRRGFYENTQADVLRSGGRYDEAVAVLRRYYDAVSCTICVIDRLAAAYDAAGSADSAIAVYERYVDLPWLGRHFSDSWSLGPAYERLAAHYTELGVREEALRYYGRLIDLWQDADEELQPRVEVARQAMNRLSHRGTNAP